LVKKWNSTVSPTFATTEFGVYVKPFCPALMVIIAADALAPRPARRLIDRCILTELRSIVMIEGI
jgi:hypothetical protein